jgi:hypothetical protein
VVDEESSAEYVISGEGDHANRTWHDGWLTRKQEATGALEVHDVKSKQMVWASEAGDRNMWVGAWHGMATARWRIVLQVISLKSSAGRSRFPYVISPLAQNERQANSEISASGYQPPDIRAAGAAPSLPRGRYRVSRCVVDFAMFWRSPAASGGSVPPEPQRLVFCLILRTPHAATLRLGDLTLPGLGVSERLPRCQFPAIQRLLRLQISPATLADLLFSVIFPWTNRPRIGILAASAHVLPPV